MANLPIRPIRPIRPTRPVVTAIVRGCTQVTGRVLREGNHPDLCGLLRIYQGWKQKKYSIWQSDYIVTWFYSSIVIYIYIIYIYTDGQSLRTYFGKKKHKEYGGGFLHLERNPNPTLRTTKLIPNWYWITPCPAEASHLERPKCIIIYNAFKSYISSKNVVLQNWLNAVDRIPWGSLTLRTSEKLVTQYVSVRTA